MNENGIISRSHGIPISLLEQQARAIGVPIIATPTSWNDYEKNFIHVLTRAKSDFGIQAMVFGDIDLQAHRDWEETVCRKVAIEAILPLWQQDRLDLVNQMINSGIETIIVSCNTTMGDTYLGRTITNDLVDELLKLGIDPCGENGEFHTLVINCPLFRKPLSLPTYEKTRHENYWFLSWKIAGDIQDAL